jgi:hypothetical protein
VLYTYHGGLLREFGIQTVCTSDGQYKNIVRGAFLTPPSRIIPHSMHNTDSISLWYHLAGLQ